MGSPFEYEVMTLPQWNITMFAGVHARREQQVISRFRTRKTAELLAYMTFRKGVMLSRDTTAEILCPGRHSQLSLTQLRVELSWLRRTLEPTKAEKGKVFTITRNTIQLQHHAAVSDVETFEQALNNATKTTNAKARTHHLREAIDLYRGELLPGIDSEWVEIERRRLAELYHHALLELADHHMHHGDHNATMAYLHKALAHDPLDEHAKKRRSSPFQTIHSAYASRTWYSAL
jgi:two-component SAPR family response regulator